VIEVSAHDLCKTRICATPGCEWDAQAASDLCFDCGRGKGQARMRSVLGTTEPTPLRMPRAWRSRSPSTDLTPPERDVLACAAKGMTIKQSAEHLGKSQNTVASQRQSALRRLDAMSLSAAVAIAMRRGLIQ
jgi:DNA-binding CsgD family transcriptional regulator